ncbi:MAG: transposase [Clostridiaceae bacterium]
MPRTYRKQSPTGLDHIMSKGITECTLFKNNNDKDKYISLIKKYKTINNIEIYAYCLMSNHLHLLVKSKNKYTLSSFMKSVNQSYAAYYNKKYDRIGPVFFDRFKNVPILTKKQTKNVSIYIHKNPKDIPGYKHNLEKYKYSSLSTYLGLIDNSNDILDSNYIVEVLNHFDFQLTIARKLYKMMMNQDNIFIDSDKIRKSDIENQKSLHSSDKRDLDTALTPNEIIDFIKNHTEEKFDIHLKYDRKNRQYTALSVLLLKYFGYLTYKKISEIIGTMSYSNISKLCKSGAKLINTKEKYRIIYDAFLNCYQH